jgi:hypothetical protein
MCPLCWTTAIATWSGLIAIGLLSVAAADKVTRLLVAVLASEVVAQFSGVWKVAWWGFAAIVSALVVRIVYLALLHRERLSVPRIWYVARGIAAKCCPSYRKRCP